MVCTDAAGGAPCFCPALLDRWESGLPPAVTRSRYRDRVMPNMQREKPRPLRCYRKGDWISGLVRKLGSVSASRKAIRSAFSLLSKVNPLISGEVRGDRCPASAERPPPA